MSPKIDDLEKKIIDLETRVAALEALGLSSFPSNELTVFPKEIISKIDKISTKNLVLISLKINLTQSINELKTNLLKIGWVKDAFFKKNFGTTLINKGLVCKIENDRSKKDCFCLTERGNILADELFIKLTKK